VFEDRDLKRAVLSEVAGFLAPDALIATNTSTLPISDIGASLPAPGNFIGMHFFSPAEKMPLLEIIVGQKTVDSTVAKALDIAAQIGKTPIVVNDSRGFFTSRVVSRFLDEAAAMVGEGISPMSIERAGLRAGYPTSPLQLWDEVTLTLPRKIRREAQAAHAQAGNDGKNTGPTSCSIACSTNSTEADAGMVAGSTITWTASALLSGPVSPWRSDPMQNASFR